MAAAHRGRLEAAKALLRAGADPNHCNAAGDAALFWAVDGGVEMLRLFVEYGADLDRVSGRDGQLCSTLKRRGSTARPRRRGCTPR